MVEWIVGGLGVGLFGYNRKNFMFDSEQRVRREFQGQNMRIKRFELYREDVRDLVDLTVSKMDNYLVVGTLLLGFSVRFFCEGRPFRSEDWPSWLIWHWAVTNIGAFLYLALSMWLAMTASIAAHSFGVRMLTQFVRLPVATREELDAATAKAEDYEQAHLMDMVRLPLLKQQLRRLNAAMASDTASQSDQASADGEGEPDAGGDAGEAGTLGGPESTVDLEHIVLYRQAQENWQAYDAYARVCMAMGTNQLLCALACYCCGLLVVEVRAPVTALCCVAVLQVSALLIVMLDVYDCGGRGTFKIAAALLFAHGLLSWVSTLGWSLRVPALRTGVSVLVPLVFLLHAAWVAFMMQLAGPERLDRVALPAKFRTVLYLDVFGWLPGGGQHGPGGPGSSACAEPPPEHLRESLRQLCVRLHSELQRDAACWEGQDVLDQATLDRIESLCERLRARAGELEQIGPGSLEAARREDAAAARVWLKLELSTSGRTVEFFLERESGEIRCTPPPDADRLLDLESFERQLTVFEDKVRTLAQFPLETQSALSHGSMVQIPRERSDSVSDTAQIMSTSGALDVAQCEARGSVELAENTTATFAATAATTYNPHVGSRTAETQGGRARRPPGLMPWRTFRTGSIVMLSISLVGALWCTVLVLFDRSHIIDITPHAARLATWRRDAALPMEPVGAGPTPHAFFRPAGLACHPGLGPALFVAERYAVHELHLGPGRWGRGRGSWRTAAPECLEGAADFLAGGIRGIQLECAPPGAASSGCEMVLLSAGGRAALRCPMRPPLLAEAGDGHAPQSQARPGRLTLHGGPWRSLLTSPEDAGVWALDDSNLVQLQRRVGSRDELVPQFVLPYSLPTNTSGLHMLRNGMVVGLESTRWLHAWSRGGAQSASWRLPSDARWSGVCADGRSLFLLGTATIDGSVTVWRTPLPSDLAAA